MVLATSRFPMMVPPVHENVPLPVKLPGPDNSAFPVSTTVVAAAIDTLAARVNASPRSNSTAPPPLRWSPAVSVPGPPNTSSTLPGPTDTEPLSLKFRNPTLAVPDREAGTVIVPVLRNSSGDAQHSSASTAAPGLSVNEPEVLISAAKDSRGPEPCTVTGPWKASSACLRPGDIKIFVRVPLSVL